MKTKLAILFAVLCNLNVYGQLNPNVELHMDEYTVIDNAGLKVTYDFSRVYDVDKPEMRLPDTHVVLIGGKVSRHYSKPFMEWAEDVSANWLGQTRYPSFKLPSLAGDYYQDYPTRGVTTVVVHKNIANCIYRYEDRCKFDWTLHDEYREILGHRCQKATVSFRGRDWIAWFTTEIAANDSLSGSASVSSPSYRSGRQLEWLPDAVGADSRSGCGPWKFSGLSGVILDVSDTESHYVWKATSVENTDEPIKFYDLKYSHVTPSEYKAMIDSIVTDQAVFNKGRGLKSYAYDGNALTIVEHVPPMPHNPIERE